MKKYFKTIDEAKKSDAKSVSKILDKVFEKGVEGAKFFYKAEFEYSNGEVAPFLYVGSPSGPWKKFVKDCKKDNDFVAGICKLEQAVDGKKLLLKAEMGKGSKSLYLKEVNKELLKKVDVKAEFVEELVINLESESDEEESEEAPVVTPPSAKRTAQELANDLKEISEVFQNIRKDHNEDQIDDLLDQISDWEDDFEALSPEHQKALAAHATKLKELGAFVQKINQIDSAIDALLEKIYPMIDEYTSMPDHASDEANTLRGRIEKAIVKVEDLAKKISDNDFLEVCEELREALAD